MEYKITNSSLSIPQIPKIGDLRAMKFQGVCNQMHTVKLMAWSGSRLLWINDLRLFNCHYDGTNCLFSTIEIDDPLLVYCWINDPSHIPH